MTELFHSQLFKDFNMFVFILYFLLTISFLVILLFFYTVIHAKNTVRRNQAILRAPKSESDNEKHNTVTEKEKKSEDEVNLSSPSRPEIFVTSDLYEKMPESYTDTTIENNKADIAAARRRSSVLSDGSSRHSSNASVETISMAMLSRNGSIPDARMALKLAVGKEEDSWVSDNSFWSAELAENAKYTEFDATRATRRRSSTWSNGSSRRGSTAEDQMWAVSGLLTVPQEEFSDKEARRTSWPRLRPSRRRHSTLPLDILNNIQEHD